MKRGSLENRTLKRHKYRAPVTDFVNRPGLETCATALSLACGPSMRVTNGLAFAINQPQVGIGREKRSKQ